MPIKQFVQGENGSVKIQRLNVAYAKALRKLDLVDRDDSLTRMIADKVIEVGTFGLTDAQEIADLVVRHFRKTLS